MLYPTCLIHIGALKKKKVKKESLVVVAQVKYEQACFLSMAMDLKWLAVTIETHKAREY